MEYQISEEAYNYFKGIEKNDSSNLRDGLLLQVGQIKGGKYAIFHIVGICNQDGVYKMQAENMASFDKESEARMVMRNMKRDIENILESLSHE